MITKINVPKTSIVIEIENGDVFEPLYWLDIKAKPEEDV